jgi:HEAT repeat protein
MKSKFDNAQNQKLISKRPNVYIVLLSSAIFAALFVFGCNEQVQIISLDRTSNIGNLRPEAKQIVQSSLADDEAIIRVNAIEVVAETGQIELMPKVQRLLKDDFVPVRFAACLAAGDLQYRLSESTLKQLLTDRDGNVRIAAAYAMLKLGDADSFTILGKALASKDQVIRANAALLLGKSGDKSALKPLYWALRDKDSDDMVRFQAVESIARLGDEQIFPKLWAVVLSSYADDRIMGIKAMGALGTEKAKEVLITKLDDDVLEVRLAAAEQLGALGDVTGEPEVLDVFTKNLTEEMDGKDLERVDTLTALAIGQIGTPALVKFLPELLKNESKTVRLAAAKAILQCTITK